MTARDGMSPEVYANNKYEQIPSDDDALASPSIYI
jgi:hypothetical protein